MKTQEKPLEQEIDELQIGEELIWLVHGFSISREIKQTKKAIVTLPNKTFKTNFNQGDCEITIKRIS